MVGGCRAWQFGDGWMAGERVQGEQGRGTTRREKCPLARECIKAEWPGAGSPSSGRLRDDLLRPGAWGRGWTRGSGPHKLTSKSTFSPSGILGAVSLKERERLMSGDPPGELAWPGAAVPAPRAGIWPRAPCSSSRDLRAHQMYNPLSPGGAWPLREGSTSSSPSVLPTSGLPRGSRKGTTLRVFLKQTQPVGARQEAGPPWPGMAPLTRAISGAPLPSPLLRTHRKGAGRPAVCWKETHPPLWRLGGPRRPSPSANAFQMEQRVKTTRAIF